MSIPPAANFGVQGQWYDPLLGTNVRRAVSELNGRTNVAAAGDAHMGLEDRRHVAVMVTRSRVHDPDGAHAIVPEEEQKATVRFQPFAVNHPLEIKRRMIGLSL